MPQIPELPGAFVLRHSEQDRWVKGEVSKMCGVGPERYVLLVLIRVWDWKSSLMVPYVQVSGQPAYEFRIERPQ
jgi:hypothetical protein